jgi:hypothetical protein
MLLILPASAYSGDCVFFSNSVKNNIIDESLFTRLLYSTSSFTTNGLYLRNFTPAQLRIVEIDLLKLYNSPKTKMFTISDHNPHHSMIKISGVWETATAVGLAFKFSHLF